MWLLHTRKLTLERFDDETFGRYAILSHRWQDEEITHRDILSMSLPSPKTDVMRKRGWQKIVGCCRFAAQAEYDYVWIDTCCIDKDSSTELSESINSMYRYYRRASVCYVYLVDVDAAAALERDAVQFRNSAWFTRGWTLQELIAPREIYFLDSAWVPFGSKESLCQNISRATGIDEGALNDTKSVHGLSVACRMSWAANRVTARIEDIAYCLMGIFNVNMPMLYGEGSKAFIRLQEEIIRTSNDHSIFAWSDPSAHKLKRCGLLAPHPRCFAHSSDFGPTEGSHRDSLLLSMTNNGLSVEMGLLKRDDFEPSLAVLNCVDSSRQDIHAAIFLSCINDKFDRFRRACPTLLWRSRKAGDSRRIYIRQEEEKEEEGWEQMPAPEFPTHLDRQWLTFIRGRKLPSRDVKMRRLATAIGGLALEAPVGFAGPVRHADVPSRAEVWRMYLQKYSLPRDLVTPAFVVEVACKGTITYILIGRQEQEGPLVADVVSREAALGAGSPQWNKPEVFPLTLPLTPSFVLTARTAVAVREGALFFTANFDILECQTA